MNFFYVEFDDGDFFTTGFNGTLEDAKEYYLGKEFERFDEKMHKCIKVEIAGINKMKMTWNKFSPEVTKEIQKIRDYGETGIEQPIDYKSQALRELAKNLILQDQIADLRGNISSDN